MATLLKVLNNLADIKSAGGVALRVRTQGLLFIYKRYKKANPANPRTREPANPQNRCGWFPDSGNVGQSRRALELITGFLSGQVRLRVDRVDRIYKRINYNSAKRLSCRSEIQPVHGFRLAGWPGSALQRFRVNRGAAPTSSRSTTQGLRRSTIKRQPASSRRRGAIPAPPTAKAGKGQPSSGSGFKPSKQALRPCGACFATVGSSR
jgi:hypothetical protein